MLFRSVLVDVVVDLEFREDRIAQVDLSIAVAVIATQLFEAVGCAVLISKQLSAVINLAVAIQNKGEDYAFVIEEASEVMTLTPSTKITIPHGANRIKNEFIKEFHCLDQSIISVLEIPAILEYLSV